MQWLVAEEGALIKTDPDTKFRRRLDTARVKIRTESFKLIQRNVSCQFGSRKFDISLMEETRCFHVWDRRKKSIDGSEGGEFRVLPENTSSSKSRVQETPPHPPEGKQAPG